jgi:hypothetical protein
LDITGALLNVVALANAPVNPADLLAVRLLALHRGCFEHSHPACALHARDAMLDQYADTMQASPRAS